MKFAKRMDRFGEGIFSSLLEIKRRKEAAGERVIDLSVGTPNIPPAPHIREALCRAAADEKNYTSYHSRKNHKPHDEILSVPVSAAYIHINHSDYES